MRRFCCGLSVLIVLLFCACANTQDYFVEYSLSQKIYTSGRVLTASEMARLEKQVGSLLQEIEDQVSVEREDSDIARINAAKAGESIEVGEHTYAMLQLCKQLTEQTDGAFSPALYNVSQLWGFTPEYAGSYQVSRAEPSASEIEEALKNSDFSQLELTDERLVTKTNSALRLDLGGIAKGYMSDCVRSLLLEQYEDVDGIISVMSNSILLGEKQEDVRGLGYTSSLENPRRELSSGTNSGALYFMDLSDVAVSTSADSYRFYVYNGKIYKHILDPKTGRPAENGVISITVLVPLNIPNAGALADAFSTAGFCKPLTQSLAFYEKLWEDFGIGAVVLTSDYCYYSVGNYHVMQPTEYANLVNPELVNSVEDMFVCRKPEDAQDEVIAHEKEKEYIDRMEQYNARA